LVDFARTDTVPVILIARGEPNRIATKFEDASPHVTVLVQQNWEVSRAYASFKLPTGYFVDADGRIGAPVAIGPTEIISLARSIPTARMADVM